MEGLVVSPGPTLHVCLDKVAHKTLDEAELFLSDFLAQDPLLDSPSSTLTKTAVLTPGALTALPWPTRSHGTRAGCFDLVAGGAMKVSSPVMSSSSSGARRAHGSWDESHEDDAARGKWDDEELDKAQAAQGKNNLFFDFVCSLLIYLPESDEVIGWFFLTFPFWKYK